MKILNLYAGIGGNRKLWEDVEVTAVEYNAEIAAIYQEYFPDDTVIVADAHEYLLAHYKEFDFIWASPPCTSFSVASIGHHWNKDNTPKTPDALLGVEIVKKTLSLIKIFLHQNRKRVFYFENPTGKLRKLPIVRGEFDRATIDYCRYGDNRMKPTDIWTNNLYSMYNLHGWKPRPRCFPGNTKCHHEPAPRGSKTGTQGRNGAYDRSKIPPLLCQEILKSIPKPQIILP